MIHIPFYKKLISYFHPVWIARRTSKYNPVLDIHYYKRRWQLATDNALYSDGDHYLPLLRSFSSIGKSIEQVRSVLVLGTGLGSAAAILETLGAKAHTTFVDIDSVVLKLAIELMPGHLVSTVTPVCDDAKDFIRDVNITYDIVAVDIFISQDIPSFVTEEGFLRQCRTRINPGGHFILNYIVKDYEEYQQLKTRLDAIYPGFETIEFGINKVFVAKV